MEIWERHGTWAFAWGRHPLRLVGRPEQGASRLVADAQSADAGQVLRHAWMLTSGFGEMSGPVVLEDVCVGPGVIRGVRPLVKYRHGIEFITPRAEDEMLAAERICLPI